MKFPYVIAALFLPLVFVSCLDDPDCVTTTTDFVNVVFYETEENLADTLFLEQLTAQGSDSILHYRDTVTSVRLPLDPRVNTATYYFQSQYGNDTLVLEYQLGARLISEDCGAEVIFSQIEYLTQTFDSIIVVNNVPVEDITEDIRIFN